jgi:hypothetical protein
MGNKFSQVTDVQFQDAMLVIKKYLKENGAMKKPFHFRHYFLHNCNIGDYLMKVVYHKSETIKCNKPYKVVSGYSNNYFSFRLSPKNTRLYLVVIDEHGKEYKVDAENFGHQWVYFERDSVEGEFKHELPSDIIEYNRALATELERKQKRLNVLCKRK